MNVPGYLGVVGLALALGYGVRWLDPTAYDQITRRVGLSARTGWTVAVVAALWICLPVLAGAGHEEKAWAVGPAITGVGWFLLVLGVGRIGEYRLLRRARRARPDELTATDAGTLVAVAGTPTPAPADPATDPPESPFTGEPAVYADWLVQRRERMLSRVVWENVIEGVQRTTFTLADGAVAVTPGEERVQTSVENQFTVEPDATPPDAAAQFMADHSALRSPDAQRKPLRIYETLLPADEPVTVVGTVARAEEPGRVRIEGAPRDDPPVTRTEDTAGGAAPVIVQGDVDGARARLRHGILLLGGFGAAMIVAGQWLAFTLSAASLGPLP